VAARRLLEIRRCQREELFRTLSEPSFHLPDFIADEMQAAIRAANNPVTMPVKTSIV
jgi:hypothetical protein